MGNRQTLKQMRQDMIFNVNQTDCASRISPCRHSVAFCGIMWLFLSHEGDCGPCGLFFSRSTDLFAVEFSCHFSVGTL
jgi:hypothetical protein